MGPVVYVELYPPLGAGRQEHRSIASHYQYYY